MANSTDTANPIPTLEDWQHWTYVMGRAQQMLMETWADGLKEGEKIVVQGVQNLREGAVITTTPPQQPGAAKK